MPAGAIVTDIPCAHVHYTLTIQDKVHVRLAPADPG